MNSRTLIVDKKLSTPIDSYRFNSRGEINIYITKSSSSYTLRIVDTYRDTDTTLDNITSSVASTWKLIEVMRSKAYDDSLVVNVYNKHNRTNYKRLTLANSIKEQERAEILEKFANRDRNIRRRMVVATPYHSRRRKKIDPKLIRPILKQERTW